MENVVEIFVIMAMLAINALFASYEMALASISRARLEVLVQAKRRGATHAAYMKDRLEGSLAVIQLGITLAGAIAAATGGAAVDEWLSPWLMQSFNLSEGTSEFLALVMFVVPLSAMTIVFAELVPKMVGINNKEVVVLSLSPTMKVVSRVFHPAVFVFEGAVKKLMRIGQSRWGKTKEGDAQTGLLELRAAAALARSTRMIGPLEERIVMSAVQLSSRTVAEAMVPERDITTIPADANLSDALIEAHLHMHTRYPVCTKPGDAQSISGYVTFKDIVTSLKVAPAGSGVKGIIRPIRRIPVNTVLAKALTEMIRDRVHIALATTDEQVMGLITMEDIVEELVGDIRDEYDRLPAHLNLIGEGWLVGGGVTIGDLAKALGGTVLTNIDKKWTLADWVDRTRELSPRSGDRIEAEGVLVLVRKVRRNRVAEAVVHLLPGEETRRPT
ncbi:MAG: hemolysin family protein [Kiritimatiellia bacterium]